MSRIFHHSLWSSSKAAGTVDFEQPRALWQRVFSDTDRENYVKNVSAHLKGVKTKEILERQCEVPFLRQSPQPN